MTHQRAILIIAGLFILTYTNTLLNGFVGDDHVLISNNTFYHSWSNFSRLFQPGYNFEWMQSLVDTDRGTGSVSYRPVDNATYFLDFAVWGLNPMGYHLTNALVHFGNMILSYWFFVALGLATGLSLFAALLFGCHPVQSEAVCAIGYRADALACFFVLSSMLSWMVFRREGSKNASLLILSFAAYFLAVFTKESALMFPLMVFIYECAFASKDENRRKIMLSQSGFWIISALYLYLYCFVFTNSALPHNRPLSPSAAGHVMSMFGIWMEYIKAMLLPFTVHLLPTLYAPMGPVSWQLILPCVLFLAAAFICRRLPGVAFLLLWSLVFYIPVSNIVPLANPMAFRFMYLPSIGFLGALAIIVHHLVALPVFERVSVRLKYILKVSIIALCMALTMLLNGLWNNDYLIASMWVKYYPSSWKAHQVLGLLNYNNGNYPEAREQLLQSLDYGGRERDARIDCYLGMSYLAEKEWDKAAMHLALALDAAPEFPEALKGMAIVLKEKGQRAAAMGYYQKALAAGRKTFSKEEIKALDAYFLN